jgi:hypothetical protein
VLDGGEVRVGDLVEWEPVETERAVSRIP